MTCRPSTLEMRNTSTAPNAIIQKYELERSTTGITTRAQALQTSSKTNAREYTTAKLKTLATTYGLEIMPILEIFQTLQTLRYYRSRKITSSEYNSFATSPLSRSVSIRVHVEVPNGEGRARGVGAAPRRLLGVSFVQALQTSSKTNKRSSLQPSSETNAREYATAKFKTLATTVSK